MESIYIQATPRVQVGNKLGVLRAKGMIPAVVYGRSVTARPLTVAREEFARALRSAGESTLINLAIGGEQPLKVLIQDVAHDPVSDAVIHVDFRAVSMTEKITTHIPLRFTGTPQALAVGGILVKHLDRVEVEALPNDLVHEIAVDVSPLAVVGANIHVRDLVLPKGITVRNDANVLVAAIVEQVVEEEPAAERTVADVEVTAAKGKEEASAADAATTEAKRPETKKSEAKK